MTPKGDVPTKLPGFRRIRISKSLMPDFHYPVFSVPFLIIFCVLPTLRHNENIIYLPFDTMKISSKKQKRFFLRG